MKKVATIFILIVMVVGLVAAVSAQSYPQPGTTTSNSILQNMKTGNNENASVIVSYYAENGTLEYQNNTIQINPKSVKEVKAADEPLPAGFQGAAIVSSDLPLAAVTSLKNTSVPGAADAVTQSAYNGASVASDTLYFPSFWAFEFIVTRITVQNTSNAPANITLSFFDRNGNSLGTVTDTLAAHGSRTFCGCDSNDLPTGWPANFQDGSVTVTTTNGAVLAGAAVSTWGNRSAAYQALTNTDKGTTLFVPSHFRYKVNASDSEYTLFSAINIQNTSSSQSAPVTVEYYNRSDGQLALTINQTIPPGTTLGLNTKNGGDLPASSFDPLGTDWDGTVKITSNNSIDLVGTAVTNWGTAEKGGMSALPSNNAAVTSNVLFIPAQYRLDYGSGFAQWSSINLQNVGSSTIAAIDLTIEYVDSNGNIVATFTDADLPGDLASGAGLGLNTRNGGDLSSSDFDSFGTSFVGGAIITAPAGSELVATSNIIYANRASVYNGVPGN